jgi:hypothetical protein
LTVPEQRRESYRHQVLNGIPLGDGHYLRRFPVWMDYRGHFGTLLPQAQALLNAAHLRNDLEAVELAQHQLEWIVGRNPFSQSTMYGEGYDYPPLYAPFPGNITGALPVGIQTRGDRDIPYWPVQSTWTYKEVWVHPVARWIWLLRDFAGPALVEAETDSPAAFIPDNSKPARVIRLNPVKGRIRTMLPEGKYRVRSQGAEQSCIFLPAGTYHLDLRPQHAMDFDLSQTSSNDGEVQILANVHGTGSHRFRLRADNLAIQPSTQQIILTPRKPSTLTWRGRIQSLDSPWTLVVIPDENLRLKKELMGAVWER